MDFHSSLVLDCKLGSKRIYLHTSLLLQFRPLNDKFFVSRGLCRFYFSFSMTYVGAGMICSHIVNLSLLLGAVLSWGLMWPLIGNLKGHWFPKNLPDSSMKSLNGYKVSYMPT